MKGSLSSAPIVVKGLFLTIAGIADVLRKISDFLKKDISREEVSNNLDLENQSKRFYNSKL